MNQKAYAFLRKMLIGIFCIFCVFVTIAQTNVPKTAAISSVCGGYYEYLPANYSSGTKNIPIIIYIPSAASYGTGSAADLSKILTEGPFYFINNKLLPSSFTVNGEVVSPIILAPQFTREALPNEVKVFIDYILPKYRIDKARIYLTGYSVGGDVAIKYPNSGLTASKQLAAMTAGGAYNYPYVDSGAKYIAAANLPVKLYHSTDDTQAPSLWSQNFVNKINSFKPTVKALIVLFAGYTHGNAWQKIFDPTFKDGSYNIYEWMLLQRRDQAPIPRAGNDTTITLPSVTVNLKGDGSSDPDNDPISYSWRKLSGPNEYTFDNSKIADPVVTGLVAGKYLFELTVTDSFGYPAMDTMQVTVINPNPNILPVAKSGGNQIVNYPASSATLDGRGSFDTDGAIENYLWKMVSGISGYTITDSTAALATIGNLKRGTYKFSLKVTDNQGGTATDTTVIQVINTNPNLPPVVNAGADTTIYLPGTLALHGTATDADGQIVNTKWSKISGPSSYSFSDSSITNPIVSNLASGVYKFQFAATDDSLATRLDTIQVTVSNTQRVLIDVGPVITGSPDPWGKYWNNMTDGRAGIRISNAVTTLNQTSTISLEVINRIDGTYNTAATGLNSGNATGNVGEYPTNATDDYAFSYEGTTNGKWRIFGLDAANQYTIKFWGTRATGTSRIIQIRRTGDSVWKEYNSANNVNFNTAAVFTFTGLTEISFDIQTKTGNTYGYINVVDITVFNNSSNAPNKPPVSNAGPDVSITSPTSSVIVKGTASDPDGTIASTKWTQLNGPTTATITNGTQLQATFGNLAYGVYQFELKVTDNLSAVKMDTMQIFVYLPQNPTTTDSLNCGKAFKIVVLGSSTAYGMGATPIDSSWVNKYTRYIKSKNSLNTIINLGQPGYTTYQVLRPTGSIPPSNRPAPDTSYNITKALSFHPDAIIINLPSNDVAFGFTLTEQKDNYARALALTDSAHIPVWVTTTQPRSNLNNQELDSLMAMHDWTNTHFGPYALDFWTTVANPNGRINILYSAGDSVHINNQGHQIFYKRVVEKHLLDSLCIRNNKLPVVNAGIDQVLALPNNTTLLKGSASDPDGSIASTNWTQVAGPATATISTPTQLQSNVSVVTLGIYTFVLNAKDNIGGISTDTVNLTVSPPPSHITLVAGSNQVIILPTDSVLLIASASDSGSVIASYKWKQLSGPSQAVIFNDSLIQTEVNGLKQGMYKFKITVLDSAGATASDSLVVTVNPAPVLSIPIANAGADQIITLPVNTVQLTGNATDSGSIITSYKWVQANGPTGSTIASDTSLITSVSGLVVGNYQFTLTVKDSIGNAASSTTKVTVNPQPPASRPVANAGQDIIISLPNSNVVLSGSASDSGSVITSYHWTELSGPSSATLINPDSASTTASGLTSGNYQLQLMVTDSIGNISTDTIKVTVNQPPQVNAGADQIINLPASSVTVTGTATDADGTIASVQWTEVSGPSSATITNTNQLQTSIGSLIQGSYLFELRASD
ncbi:MAG: PKD domain-containing protein, partial [Flavisolibacter sp.]